MADESPIGCRKQTPLPDTWGLDVRKRNASVDDTTQHGALVLLGAVGFVLLITCANVANLFLSQAPVRQREMAIRSALGAGRGQLIRSVMVESLVLARHRRHARDRARTLGRGRHPRRRAGPA